LTALHRALDGDAPQPLAYRISRICEEFQCLPSAALRELERLPAGFLEDVIEARYYARAKADFDGAETDAARRALPASELLMLAQTITFDLVEEQRRGR
jgi:hypothetical protein